MKRYLLAILVLALAGCAGIPEQSPADLGGAIETDPMLNYYENASDDQSIIVYDNNLNSRTDDYLSNNHWDRSPISGRSGHRVDRCRIYHTANTQVGEFIGCQSISILDARTPIVRAGLDDQLQTQGCISTASSAGNRNYLYAARSFLFIDKTTGGVWFVPDGYYTDGMSLPDGIRRILPGPTWDTTSPRSTGASIVHDRYYCIQHYAANLSHRLDGMKQYRSFDCTNDMFFTALNAGGVPGSARRLMYRAVALANPGDGPYCPTLIDDVIELEQMFRKIFLQTAPLVLPTCSSLEPIILCLSRPNNLWRLEKHKNSSDDVLFALVDERIKSERLEHVRGEQKREHNIREMDPHLAQVITHIACWDHEANDNFVYGLLDVHSRYEEGRSYRAIPPRCDDILNRRQKYFDWNNAIANADQNVGNDPNSPYYMADFGSLGPPGTSPFRAGDLWIEASAILTEPNGAKKFLDVTKRAHNIDTAMAAIIDYNLSNRR